MPNHPTGMHHPKLSLPKSATAAAIRFLAEHLRLWEFRMFIFRAALANASQNPSAYADAVKRAELSQVTAFFLKVYQQQGVEEVYSFARQEAILSEMTLLQMADNYLVYCTELLSTIFLTRPEILKSGEQVRIDFVLGHGTMEDLIRSLAERKVERLSFLGMKDLSDFFADELKLPLFQDDRSLADAIRIIETRNIIVHNRGVVNARFKARVPNSTIEIGKRIPVRPDEIEKDAFFLANAVYEVDQRASTKFKLKCRPLKPDETQATNS